jgi:nocardicin N-oxygenase
MNTNHTPSGGGAPRYPFPGGTALRPPPEYARLRQADPVSRVTLPFGGEAWLAVRYSDVKFVFADPRFSRAASIRPGTPRFFEHPVAEGMGYVDPPEHTRLRGLLKGPFTPRRVDAFRPSITKIVDELLDELARGGPPADLQSAFAVPLAGRGVCDFVGVPYADRDRFAPFFNVVTSTDPVSADAATQAIQEVQAYFADLAAKERERPTDTFFGALVRRNDEERRVTEEELVNLAFGVVVAAYETTSAQLGNALVLLLRGPDPPAAGLRAHPEIAASAVDELLRYTQLLSYGGNPYVATEDLVLEDTLISAGDVVVPSINAANRDERVFADPDTLDLRRHPNPHLSFSHGAHFCLGAPLARAELEIGLSGLVNRFPELRPAVPFDGLRWKPDRVMRSLESLPAEW